MATIESLPNKSILDMSAEESFLHIREIRQSRRTIKKAPKKSAPKAEKPKSADQLVNMMSAEMAEEFLKNLEGGER